MGVDKIIAFGPQTLVTEQVFQKFKSLDSRITEIDLNSEFLDLKRLLENTAYAGVIEIHFGQHHQEDKTAAMRLAQFKNVRLCPWDTDTHNILIVSYFGE